MRLKSFIAANVPEAMALVREQLGANAVILSTQNDAVSGKVKITAALEEEPLDAYSDEGSAPEALSEVLHSLDQLAEALEHHRVPLGLADRMLAAAGDLPTPEGPLALAGAIDAVLKFSAPPDGGDGRPVMLVGPPGAGKTATAAKLCARARHAEGEPACLITMDGEKAGGLAQIAAFSEALDAPLQTAETPEDLVELLPAGPLDRLVVIDTPGCNPLDGRAGEALVRAAEAVSARMVLVLSAGGDVLEAAEWAETFAGWGATRLIATKLDTTRRLGSLLSAADAGGLTLCGVGISPNIGGGLTPVNPVSLARLLLSDAGLARQELSLATGTDL